MGEISVSGMALGLSTGKTKVVALAKKRTEPAGITRIMTLGPSRTDLQVRPFPGNVHVRQACAGDAPRCCLLYTSDAADE